jgi:hypothetical protein
VIFLFIIYKSDIFKKNKVMTSIITGDIIHSQKVSPLLWLDILKVQLNIVGKTPEKWEIFRGDSFQAEIENPSDALEVAIRIKASIKCIKQIDVRMAIGIGDKTHNALKITESNGSAFVNSGEQFEKMKKEKRNLAVSGPSERFNRDINLFLRLALIAMDNWTVNSAQTVKAVLENPEKSQKELGELLGIKQNAISNRLKRAYFEEIKALLEIYKLKIQELI